MERAIWYVKQLLPLRYVSEYIEGGEARVSVWRMWFGRCFDVKTWRVKQD